MQALNIETNSSPLAEADAKIGSPGYQAYRILQFGFTVAPIVMGLDKFFGLLVNWDQYLPSFVNNMVGGHGHSLMYLVGVIEVIAGLGVWFKPRIFAYVVAAWLFLIIANLLMIPGYDERRNYSAKSDSSVSTAGRRSVGDARRGRAARLEPRGGASAA